MRFLVGYNTSVGIKKSVNQDALCIKKAKIGDSEILLTVICDGMGGLASGELASATVIRRFSKWFEEELPTVVLEITPDMIKEQWTKMIYELNEQLWSYGKDKHAQLGTTLTAVLFLQNGTYVTAHVGDTRQYCLNSSGMKQVTEDQTFVAREVKRGNMTLDQAMADPRRNVLLQCIGASEDVEPAFWSNQVMKNDMFLLCSDGFRHVLKEEEIYEKLMNEQINTEQEVAKCLDTLIKINETRGETDNITAIVVRTL